MTSDDWYDDDSLWVDFAPAMFSGTRAETVAELVRTASLLDFPPGSRVLDLCCGPGLFLLPPGRPRPPGDRCRSERGHAGARRDRVPGGGRRRRPARTRGHAHVRRPRGLRRDLPDGSYVAQRDTVLDSWRRLRTDWTLVRGGRARTASIRSFLYSAAELHDLFVAAGFADVECFGDFDGGPYDQTSRRLVVRGVKK